MSALTQALEPALTILVDDLARDVSPTTIATSLLDQACRLAGATAGTLAPLESGLELIGSQFHHPIRIEPAPGSSATRFGPRRDMTFRLEHHGTAWAEIRLAVPVAPEPTAESSLPPELHLWLRLAAAVLFERIRKNEYREQVRHLRRLAWLGTTTAEFIHELSNPLTTVQNVLGLAQAELPTACSESCRRALTIAATEAQRAARLTSSAHLLVRSGHAHRERCDLNELTHRVLALEQIRLQRSRITLACVPHAGSAAVLGFPEQIMQVILNLASNAAQAIPPERLPAVIRMRVGADSTHVFVDVSDTGTGIQSDYQSRIFEPFFTTKASKHGLGLGLSLARQIARDHGGDLVLVKSSVDGSTFRLVLPVARGEMTSLPTSPAATRPAVHPMPGVPVSDF